MSEVFSRFELLIGKKSLEILKKSRVIVFGVGGVGGHVIEGLVRSGLENIDIVDNDTISPSNLNRQIIALHSTIGENKVDVMEKRIKDINPNCSVKKWNLFFLPETSEQIDFSVYDYVVDCVDTVSAKIEIIKKAKLLNIPIISSMGTGNKLSPLDFEITDITKTSVCPLARVIRQELKKLNIKNVKVLYSKENPILPKYEYKSEQLNKKSIPGSSAFVPSVAGLVICSEVVKDLIK
ncbi:MAG: tRNA threonylcarbamoyladenosine dehydratase [Treponema sp.]|nr:tRNA threonylcarbamoyladenosine dehydratase [Treponema sp.]